MADIQSIFLPRRGKKSTMAGTKKTQVLAKGELFVEAPDTGVGTGHSRVKIGDGATQYGSLPYAWGDTENDKIAFTANTSTTVAAALNSVVSGNSLATLIAGLKQAIVKADASITSLNDELVDLKDSFNDAKDRITGSDLGVKLGMTSTSTWDSICSKIEAVSVASGRPDATSATTIGTYLNLKVPKGYYDGTVGVEWPIDDVLDLLGGSSSGGGSSSSGGNGQLSGTLLLIGRYGGGYGAALLHNNNSNLSMKMLKGNNKNLKFYGLSNGSLWDDSTWKNNGTAITVTQALEGNTFTVQCSSYSYLGITSATVPNTNGNARVVQII